MKNKFSELAADNYHIPLLGRLPLNIHIRENSDKGKPSVIAQGAAYESYMDIARHVKKHNKKRIF